MFTTLATAAENHLGWQNQALLPVPQLVWSWKVLQKHLVVANKVPGSDLEEISGVLAARGLGADRLDLLELWQAD